MNDNCEQLVRLLTEDRDLLRLVAEPAIAQRDANLRAALRRIAGTAKGKKAKAALLMDGTRTRPQIIALCGITKGDLSVLVKRLSESELIAGDPKLPQLAISIPPNFFELEGEANE